MSQNNQVLMYLRDHPEGMTPIDAIREFGIMRLGARVDDLKKMGHSIFNVWETNVNRYGKPVRYARYVLVEF